MPFTEQQEIRSRNTRLFNHSNFSGNRAFFTSLLQKFCLFSAVNFRLPVASALQPPPKIKHKKLKSPPPIKYSCFFAAHFLRQSVKTRKHIEGIGIFLRKPPFFSPLLSRLQPNLTTQHILETLSKIHANASNFPFSLSSAPSKQP